MGIKISKKKHNNMDIARDIMREKITKPRKSIEWENMKNLIKLSDGIEVLNQSTEYNKEHPFGTCLRVELVDSGLVGEWLFPSVTKILLCISSNAMIGAFVKLKDDGLLVTIRTDSN
jgi:hypothetical protein